LDADLIAASPDHGACSLKAFEFDDEFEGVRYCSYGLDAEPSARFRNVTNDTRQCRVARAEGDIAALQDSLTWASAALHGDDT
jgi:hypothetical protein